MADDPLRAALVARRDEIRAKIATRKGKSGMAENVELLETMANELDRLLAQPEGEA